MLNPFSILTTSASLFLLLACSGSTRSSQAEIDAAVRATLSALPPAEAQIIEVTRVVEATAVASAEETPAPDADAATSADGNATDAQAVITTPSIDAAAEVIVCPTFSENQYALIPMEAVDVNHPDHLHGDLNLALRGFEAVDFPLELIDLGAGGDDPPQMQGLFTDSRLPTLTQAYAVYDWDWGCGEHGCTKSEFVKSAEVSAVSVATNMGETVSLPSNNTEIYAGNYIAAVLYAAPDQLTLAYTRDGSVAGGYSVHLLNFCVDPNLLRLYQAANEGGRVELPGLRNNDPVGVATDQDLIVAIRTRGRFLDPRSRGDWWR